MDFKVLGPLELDCDGEVVHLSGIKQRAFLAYMLLHSNQVVAGSRLLRALWPVGAPATARKILLNSVSSVRRKLANAKKTEQASIKTQAPGYIMRIDPGNIDLGRFRSLVAAGRRDIANGSFDRGSSLLREALGFWRGAALDDLAQAGHRWPEINEINDTRVSVLEDLFASELGCGRHWEIMSELRTAFDQNPLRERLCVQLMTAMYRCGRQAHALELYRKMRHQLVNQLGVEPGRELQEVHRQVLNQDESLMTWLNSDTRVSQQTKSTWCAGGHRKEISILQVAVSGEEEPEKLEKSLKTVSSVLAESCEEFGGKILHAVGASVPVVFGATYDVQIPSVVHAALAVRSRLDHYGLTAKVVVAAGEALVKRGASPDNEEVEITSRVHDECWRLLLTAPLRSIRVCERTYTSSRRFFQFERHCTEGRLVSDQSEDASSWALLS